MTVATQGGGAAETTTPRPDTLTISVRFSTGTYVARAKGHKQTASCTENAYRAAERLTEKLGMDPKTLELREHLDQRWIFQTIELVPGEFTHFCHLCPDCGQTHLVPITKDAPHPYCCGRGPQATR
ncbi:hypothetical protein AAIH45_33255, partial [Pseudomonas aeruginosa]